MGLVCIREIDWLREALADGAVPAAAIFEAARAKGLNLDRLKAAKSAMGVIGSIKEIGAPWVWRLPTESELERPAGKTGWPNAEMLGLWLYGEWKAKGGANAAKSVFDQVEWVAERLILPMHFLAPEELIGAGALGLLLWARDHENEFRQMYDCKRMERPAARPAGKVGGNKTAGAGKATVERMMNRNGG